MQTRSSVQSFAKTIGEARAAEEYVRRKRENNKGPGKWRFRYLKFLQSENGICQEKG